MPEFPKIDKLRLDYEPPCADEVREVASRSRMTEKPERWAEQVDHALQATEDDLKAIQQFSLDFMPDREGIEITRCLCDMRDAAKKARYLLRNLLPREVLPRPVNGDGADA